MTTPEEPNAVDDITDASTLLDQWETKLKEAPGDIDAKAQLRNWTIPMFRKLISIVEAVAGDTETVIVAEVDAERVAAARNRLPYLRDAVNL